MIHIFYFHIPDMSTIKCSMKGKKLKEEIQKENKMHHIYLNQFLSFFFGLFRDSPAAYGGSQTKSRIGAVAAGLQPQ